MKQALGLVVNRVEGDLLDSPAPMQAEWTAEMTGFGHYEAKSTMSHR